MMEHAELFTQFVGRRATILPTKHLQDVLAIRNANDTFVIVIYDSGQAKSMQVVFNDKRPSFATPGNGWATVHWKY